MVWSVRKMRYCIDTEERIVSLGVNLVSGMFLFFFFFLNVYAC